MTTFLDVAVGLTVGAVVLLTIGVIVLTRALQRAERDLAIALRHTDELRRIIARYGLVELELVQDADGTHYRAHVKAAPLPRRNWY